MRTAEAYAKMMLLLLLEKKTFGSMSSKSLGIDFLNNEDEKKKSTNVYNTNADRLYNALSVLVKDEDKDFSIEGFLSSLELKIPDDTPTFNIIKERLKDKFDAKVKKYLYTEIDGYIKKERVIRLLKKTTLKLYNPIGNIENTMEELISGVNTLIDISHDDEGTETVDLNNDTQVGKAADKAADMFKTGGVYKTGWSCINDMLQGGCRRGEFGIISALSHNYKSSFLKSLFVQIARLNTPEVIDDRKNLLVFLSLEEDLRVVFLFFYVYLKMVVEGEILDPDNVKVESSELQSYIKEHFTKVTKFDIKVIRMDPTKVTYSTILGLADRYKKEGYNVHGFFADYIGQCNMAGCTFGTTGAEYRDFFKRVRNGMALRNIFFLSPHQLSPAAKSLQRTGLSGQEFTQQLINNGYFEFSSKLDQEMDISLFITKHYINKKPYLGVQLDKHRIPTIAPDEFRYTDLVFPKGGPIPEDIGLDGEPNGKQVCMKQVGNVDEFEL